MAVPDAILPRYATDQTVSGRIWIIPNPGQQWPNTIYSLAEPIGSILLSVFPSTFHPPTITYQA